jgi:hypothetical protein
VEPPWDERLFPEVDNTAVAMDDEVIRLEQVRLLQGATGHGVFSTLALAAAGLLLAVGERGPAVLLVVLAYGIALNGLSIYAWDDLRARAEARFERGREPDRALTPHRISAEMKAELLAGLVIAGSLILVLGVSFRLAQLLGIGTMLPLSIAGLAVGNVGALWRAYRKGRGRPDG